MAPFLARFFRLVVVDPGFISLTILPRKPSPSASKHFKSSWQASNVILSILQSAGVAPTLQTLYGIAEYHE
jgi:hypothetical protein